MGAFLDTEVHILFFFQMDVQKNTSGHHSSSLFGTFSFVMTCMTMTYFFFFLLIHKEIKMIKVILRDLFMTELIG